MLKYYLRAAINRKKLVPGHKPDLNHQRVIYQLWQPHNRHYRHYCRVTEWPEDGPMHPLYWQVCSMPMQLDLLTEPSAPFPAMGLVHLKNEVQILAPVRQGIQCELSVRYGELHVHPKGWAFEVVTSVVQRGRCCYRAVATYFYRSEVKSRAITFTPLVSADKAHLTTLAELDIGVDIGRSYARVSGDYNPIHLTALTAKLFGFKRAIAHGMWSLAVSYSYLRMANKLPLAEGTQLLAEFKRPLYLPNKASLMYGLRPDDSTDCADFCLQSAQGEVQYLYGCVLKAGS
jgi:hypothetical protein